MKKRHPPSSTYHLCLLVDRKFSDLVKSVSCDINRKFKSEFIVDGKNYLPHITLYLFSAPIKNQKKIIERTRVLLVNCKKTAAKVRGLFINDGWLMVDMENANAITMFHKDVIKVLNPLREGILRKKYRKVSLLDKLSDTERTILLKYGDKHASRAFHPHISLAKFDETETKSFLKSFKTYQTFFRNKEIRTVSLRLVRSFNESAGTGKMLFEKVLQ